MKKERLVAAALVVSTLMSAGKKSNPVNPQSHRQQPHAIAFTENKGQFHDQNYMPRTDVLAGAKAGAMVFHLTTSGISYQLSRVDKWEKYESKGTTEKLLPAQQTHYRVDLEWLDANRNFRLEKHSPLPGHTSYYLHSCPDGALNVQSYQELILQNLYEGINLHYYQQHGELKHDYIVSAGADYRKIALRIKGAKVALQDDGSLLLKTPLGDIQEGKPLVFQNGKALKSRWQVNGDVLRFEIEGVNPASELIIDPLTRVWGTYYGADGLEEATECAIDGSNDVYVSGNTTSTSSLLATSGTHSQTNAGSIDAYVAKFDANGVRLWGTYYGGTQFDLANSCAVDSTGSVFITGHTASSNGIATPGSHQTVYGGGGYDAYLVKFNGNGVRQWATYYGGATSEYGFGCKADPFGNIYVTGYSASVPGTIIATPGSHQPAFGGGAVDAFLVKFNTNGVRQWGTYYGGANDDNAAACVTDISGDVYIVGYTNSSAGTAIATLGSHQPVYGGGNSDAFIAKFSTNGARLWGSYYGGTGYDNAMGCARDAAGNFYMAGYTGLVTSSNVATANSHQTALGGGGDAFLVKFDNTGMRLWGTYYGGINNERGLGCAVDITGNIYLSGFTASPGGTVIATNGAHQQNHSMGMDDAFLAMFDSNGNRLYGT